MSVYHIDRTATHAETAQEMDRRGQVIVRLETEIARLTAALQRSNENCDRMASLAIDNAKDILRLTAEVERLKGDYETAHERGLADRRALCIEQQKLIHKQAAEVERLRAALERIAADAESDADLNEWGAAAVALAALKEEKTDD